MSRLENEGIEISEKIFQLLFKIFFIQLSTTFTWTSKIFQAVSCRTFLEFGKKYP